MVKAKKEAARPTVRKGRIVKAAAKPAAKQVARMDRTFWHGLAIVSAGVVALLLFLGIFLRYIIGFALYQDTQGESAALSQQTQELAVKSAPLAAAVQEEASGTAALPSGEMSASEFMDLPETGTSLADLNFLNSPDGSKFAYAVKDEEGRSAVILNGEAGPYYDEITFMSFSPDSAHFAYGVRIGSEEAVVIDGKQGKTYQWIFLPRFFSPDSKYFIYKTRTEAGDILVFNEEEGPAYEQIYAPFVSDDKSQLVYYARTGNKIYKNVLGLEKYEK